MKKADVQIGATYLVKVASNLVPVKIDREHDNGGWEGRSVKTGKTIRIKSAQRLRFRLYDAGEKPEQPTSGKLSGLSCLDAAAAVLAEAAEPLSCLDMFDRMHADGLWTSDKATPQNTIYAAILREIRKGGASRFRKAAPGRFELNR
jgi:hypothetical protein